MTLRLGPCGFQRLSRCELSPVKPTCRSWFWIGFSIVLMTIIFRFYEAAMSCSGKNCHVVLSESEFLF